MSSVLEGQHKISSLQIQEQHCNPEKTCRRCGSRPDPPARGISKTDTQRPDGRQKKGGLILANGSNPSSLTSFYRSCFQNTHSINILL